jgi:hypothetical protein
MFQRSAGVNGQLAGFTHGELLRPPAGRLEDGRILQALEGGGMDVIVAARQFWRVAGLGAQQLEDAGARVVQDVLVVGADLAQHARLEGLTLGLLDHPLQSAVGEAGLGVAAPHVAVHAALPAVDVGQAGQIGQAAADISPARLRTV